MSERQPVGTKKGWLREVGARLWEGRVGKGWAAVRLPWRRRVPVIRQMSGVECGAACLAMVLGHHGCRVRLAECREACAPGRDGITARTIAQAARRFGLVVKGFSLEPAQLRYVPLPAIAHWGFDHFVVVERWTPRGVEIVDPAWGRRRLTPAEFDAKFTGVVLTLLPGVDFRRRRASGEAPWRAYVGMLLQVPGLRGLLGQVVGASLFLQGFGLIVPLFTQVLVDRILPYRITNVMAMLGLGVVVLVLARAVMSYLRAALLIYLQARTDTRMMVATFAHMLSLPYRYFQQRETGDLLLRLGSNQAIRDVLTTQTVSILLDGLFVCVYLVLLMALAPLFGGLVVGLGLLQVGLLWGTHRKVHALMERELAVQAAEKSYLVEAVKGIATLKAAGAEERALDHWANRFFAHLNVSLQQSQFGAMVETALGTLSLVSPFALLWVGAHYVLGGGMTLGTMLALNALAGAFLMPLSSLVMSGRQFQVIGAHLERLADVLEAAPEQEASRVRPAPPLTGRIEVRNVSFRYDPQAAPVLRNISLTIAPGEKVALVGRTGSGKSTLALLLLGLLTPTEGEIRYDGIPLEELDYRTVRRQVGVVLQDAFLFAGSIRENIALNDPGLPLEAVMEAARLAAIHEEIVAMPMGYETRVAEGGSALSGGQRQRLALARAVAHRPAILVLDEATSHLDVTTEEEVDRNLSRLECTRLVIAHRLSTIRNADRILVLEGGEVVEAGSHEALLARNGRYAALVNTQQAASPGAGANLPIREDAALATGRTV